MSEERAEPVLTLDTLGRHCPVPVIELNSRHGEVAPGGVIAVVATDAAARVDIPAWGRMRGHEYVGEDTAPDGVPRYLVRRVAPTGP